MGIYDVSKPDFFATFDGDFANTLFYSRLKRFDLTTYDTLLSVKVAIRGPEEYVVDGKRLVIPEGHYCVINPRDKVETSIDADEVAEGISIFLDRELVSDVICGFCNGPSEIEPDSAKQADQPWFEERVNPLEADAIGRFLLSIVKTPTDRFTTDDFFNDLAGLLVAGQRNYWRQLSRLSAIKASTRIEIRKRLEIGRQMMMELDDPTTSVNQIARRCCLTNFNFIRFYKAVFKETPYQVLLQKRIERAKKLLTSEPDRAIGEIASTLGFADHTTFGKRFKAMTGCTPSEFRNSSLQS